MALRKVFLRERPRLPGGDGAQLRGRADLHGEHLRGEGSAVVPGQPAGEDRLGDRDHQWHHLHPLPGGEVRGVATRQVGTDQKRMI